MTRDLRSWFPVGLIASACAPTLPPERSKSTTTVAIAANKPTAQQDRDATHALPPCPTEQPERDGGYPPWHSWSVNKSCIRTADSRWSVTEDTTDAEGWSHFLNFESVSGETWRRDVIAPTALGRRTDNAVVVLDLKNGATLFAKDGTIVWRSQHPDCGAVQAIAIALDHSITFTCGYSVLHLNADGTLAWQKWPFGDKGIGGPWVDRSGTLYVSGGGDIAAMNNAGETLWKTSTGGNRAIGPIRWNNEGHLVFDTSMAERHTSGEFRIYHEPEDNEVFIVAKGGRVVKRTQYTDVPTGGWPAVLPVPEDGSRRVP